MEYTQIIDRDGVTKNVPSQHFQINTKQQIVCVGIDLKNRKIIPEVPEGFECMDLGWLESQGAIMNAQLVNSLSLYNWNFIKYPDPWVFLIQPVAKEEEDEDSLETCPYCGIPFTTYDNGNGVCVKCGHTNDNSFDEEGILYEAFSNENFKPKIAYFTENILNDIIPFKEKLDFFAKVECVPEELLYWEDCMKSFHSDYYIPSAAPGQRIKKYSLIQKFLELGWLSETGGAIGSHAAIEREKEFH